MYNRYIPNGTAYTRISEPDAPPPPPPSRQKAKQGKAAQKSGLLSGLLRSLKLEELDTGDVLLLLILLLLFLEGDDMELVIALGLILLLGLGDD